MRLGAPLHHFDSPDTWVEALQTAGYRASYCPVKAGASMEEIRAYESAAEAADIVIAEVGVWNNPLSPDEATRQNAIAFNQQQLALADEIGARCCVNIAGSRGEQWDGPHPDNFSAETFDLIVQTVQTIIDAVKPKRTFYTLETMPWIVPDSVESYLELIKAIDRPQFAAHLDPVNIISSPRLYYNNGAFLEDCFAKLGPYIKACHAKDTIIRGHLTVHLDEVRPGLGTLDYRTLLRCMDRLPDPDVPFMLEHLPQGEYEPAAAYVREIAAAEGIAL
jgi:sugar phosphate isomerase/epimerase